MFFSKLKFWQDESLLAEKSTARKECLSESAGMFVIYSIATGLLGLLFAGLVYGGVLVYGKVNETFVIVSFLCTLSLYGFLLYGIVVTSISAVNSLYLFFKCLFTRVEDYDLSFRPAFRM